MADEFDLIAEYREDEGKGASRRLRRQGMVPAIIYGGGRPPRSLMFEHTKVLKQLDIESFFSSILNVRVGDTSQAVILKDVQRHPSRRQVMHIDLQRVVEDEEIRMNVPIHFIGEDIAIGVKEGGGKVSRLMTDVEVTCLPKDLPEYFEVDVSQLALDEMLNLSDIKLPPGVEIPELAQGPERDHAIVSIHVIKEIIEEELVEPEPGEVPTEEVEPEVTDEGESSTED